MIDFMLTNTYFLRCDNCGANSEPFLDQAEAVAHAEGLGWLLIPTERDGHACPTCAPAMVVCS